MAVFVLDKKGRPLMPCTEKRARLLLERGRARIHKKYPFTIRLVDRLVEDSELQPLGFKVDSGSKGTGIALVRFCDNGDQAVLSFFTLIHRGRQISEALSQRRGFRRRRRSANLRYRAPRFNNRKRHEGWLAPSLQHRVDSVENFQKKLFKLAPITEIVMETVRFDTQLMQNPDISGVEYQQGELFGFEVREYLLEKWGRTCAYCGAKNTPLEVEHIVPKSKGGSNRVSNLTLACRSCNEAKGNRSIEEFLEKKPQVLNKIKAQAKAPLRDAAAVNSTRNALYNALCNTGLPVKTSTGGRTKFNRTRLGIPKNHALDAACVGEVERILNWQIPILEIRCMGRGAYKRTRLDKYGFPRGYLMRQKQVQGFATGDLVRADVPKGRHTGVHKGRIAVRSSGSFALTTASDRLDAVSYKHCHLIQRNDGYGYFLRNSSPD